MSEELAKVIRDCFSSANVDDSNGETANLVDTTDDISASLRYISSSIDRTDEQLKRIADALFYIGDKMV